MVILFRRILIKTAGTLFYMNTRHRVNMHISKILAYCNVPVAVKKQQHERVFKHLDETRISLHVLYVSIVLIAHLYRFVDPFFNSQFLLAALTWCVHSSLSSFSFAIKLFI